MSNKEQLLTSPQKKRIFFALWLDDEVVQRINQNVIKYFSNCQGRILEKNNWHITLAYFGASDINTQSCLEVKAGKVKSQPFELNLSKCGFWPQPKVAWLAPEEIPEALKELTSNLQHLIEPCGFKTEIREYQPHITLVRKAKQQPTVAEVDPISWQVRQFCLVESKTYPEGAQYKVLKSWDLS